MDRGEKGRLLRSCFWELFLFYYFAFPPAQHVYRCSLTGYALLCLFTHVSRFRPGSVRYRLTEKKRRGKISESDDRGAQEKRREKKSGRGSLSFCFALRCVALSCISIIGSLGWLAIRTHRGIRRLAQELLIVTILLDCVLCDRANCDECAVAHDMKPCLTSPNPAARLIAEACLGKLQVRSAV